MKIEQFKREIENYCSNLEEILNSNSYSRDKEKIVNITQATNNILYGSAIGTFVLTMEGSTKILDEKDFEKLKPLLDHWKRHKENDSVPIDPELFADFKESLNEFSHQNPDLFSHEDEPISLLEYFKKFIWVPIFQEYEQRIQSLTDQLNHILERVNNKYQLMIDTEYELIEPFEFEELIAKLFNKMGYMAEVTSKTGDFGIDVIGKKENDVIAIQAKKYSSGNNIGNRTIQRLIGVMSYKDYKASKGILITTSDFTVQAHEQAKENPVELWNQQYLNKMITKYFINQESDEVPYEENNHSKDTDLITPLSVIIEKQYTLFKDPKLRREDKLTTIKSSKEILLMELLLVEDLINSGNVVNEVLEKLKYKSYKIISIQYQDIQGYIDPYEERTITTIEEPISNFIKASLGNH